MTVIVAHVGDLHVNSAVALMPASVTRDDGQTVLPSKTQRWLWANWLDYWSKTAHYKQASGARVIGVINGDWGDVNRHSQFQLIEPVNTDTVIDMMVAVAEPMRRVCDDIVIVRGTEAHTGGAGWLEERAAKEIGATRNPNEGTASWYIWEAEVEGVRITSAHHPGTNATRPWTAGNEAGRRAAMDFYNYAGSGWLPHLTLWGHYHHYADSHDTHPVRAIYNRAWQLKTAFVHRIGLGNNPEAIGGLWVFCKAGQYRVQVQAYPLPRPEPWKA